MPDYDIVVVGGGMAALTAGLFAARLEDHALVGVGALTTGLIGGAVPAFLGMGLVGVAFTQAAYFAAIQRIIRNGSGTWAAAPPGRRAWRG